MRFSMAAGLVLLECLIGFAAASAQSGGLTVKAEDQTIPYGGVIPTLTYKFTDGGAAGLKGKPLCSTTATTKSPVGEYPITCVQGSLPAGHYNFEPGTLTIQKAKLTCAAKNATMTYGDALPALGFACIGYQKGDDASVLSGAPELSVDCSNPISAARREAGASGCVYHAGTYAINIAQGGLVAGNYTFTFENRPATSGGILTVTPAPLSCVADSKAVVYGTASPAYTFTCTGYKNGDTAAVLTGTPMLTSDCGAPVAPAKGGKGAKTAAPKGTGCGFKVGSYPITIAQGTLVSPDYSFNMVNRNAGVLMVTPVSLTVTAENKNIFYGDGVPPLTYNISGYRQGDNASVVAGKASCSTTATAKSPVGTYPITCTKGNLSTPDYSFEFVAGTLTIGRAPLTCMATNASMVYGAALPAFNFACTGYQKGDDASVLSGAPSLASDCSNPVGAGHGKKGAACAFHAGQYAIEIAQGTLAAANYSFNFVNQPSATGGVLTVTSAPLNCAADNKSMVYGAALPAFTFACTGYQNGDTVSSLTGAPSLASNCGAAPRPAKGGGKQKARPASGACVYQVGTYAITIGPGSLANPDYKFSWVNGQPAAGGELKVTPAELTVTAENKSIIYGDPLPPLTYRTTGQVNGDAANATSGAASCTTTANATSPAGTYPVNCAQGSLTSPNYTFKYASGTLTIGQATLTCASNNATMVYGAAQPAFHFTCTGYKKNETAAILTGQPSLIAACETPLATSRHGTPGEPGCVYHVGKYALTIDTGTLSAGGNYKLAFTNGQPATGGILTVTPAALSCAADAKAAVYGAALPGFTFTCTGYQNGDSASALLGAPALASNCGSSPAPSRKSKGMPQTGGSCTYGVGKYPISIAQGSLVNEDYKITYVNGQPATGGLLTITPAALTVTADNKSITYGQKLPPMTYTVTGYVHGDTAAALGGAAKCATVATSTSAAGTHPITCAQGSLTTPNYIFNFAAGVLTIGKALLTCTANPTSMVYGSALVPFGFSCSGYQNGDTAAVLSGQPSLTSSCANPLSGGRRSSGEHCVYHAGTYAIEIGPGSLSAGGNYTLAFQNGQPAAGGILKVTPAPLNCMADNKTMVYGSAQPAYTFTCTGFQHSDTVSTLTGAPSLGTACQAIAAPSKKGGKRPAPVSSSCVEQVGSYGITIDKGSLDDPDYAFTFVNGWPAAGGVLTVTPAVLTVTANSKVVVAGGKVPQLSYSITGHVHGDAASVVSGAANCSTTATPSSPQGTYSITCSQGSLAAGNYTFSFAPGTLTITEGSSTGK
jgi:hypothetical protein